MSTLTPAPDSVAARLAHWLTICIEESADADSDEITMSIEAAQELRKTLLARQPAARDPEGLELVRWIINRQGLPDTLNKSSDEVIAIYQAEMLRASEPAEGEGRDD